MTGRVRDMIMDPAQTGRLTEVIAEGALLRDADLRPGAASTTSRPAASTSSEAMRAATSPHDFKLLLAADGRRGTTMDDVADSRAAA